MNDYIEQANRTASSSFHAAVDKEDFLQTIEEAIDALQNLDLYKKYFFYGKKPADGVIVTTDCADCSMRDVPPLLQSGDDSAGRNMLHGIIGMATEAGELLEALREAIVEKRNLDAVNVSEEIGDSFWYSAMLLRVAGKSFGDVQNQNISKLRARFPEKFTEELANNRDLKTERQVLEDLN